MLTHPTSCSLASTHSVCGADYRQKCRHLPAQHSKPIRKYSILFFGDLGKNHSLRESRFVHLQKKFIKMPPSCLSNLSIYNPLTWLPPSLPTLHWSPSKPHSPLPLYAIITATHLPSDDPLSAAQKPVPVFFASQDHGMTSSGTADPLLSPRMQERQRTEVEQGSVGLRNCDSVTFEFWWSQVLAQPLLLPFLPWHMARRGREGDSKSEFSRVLTLRTVPACPATSPGRGQSLPALLSLPRLR